MFKIFTTRFKFGHQTLPFPPTREMPERFRGHPCLKPELCEGGCVSCRDICPAGAISLRPLTIDLGKCVFCGECRTACPKGAITFTRDLRISALRREDLILKGDETKLAAALKKETTRLFGRSLKLRVVTAGSCNGCEMELNAVSNIQFDIGRFGIQIVASPRHADGIIVTGPVSNNMKLALEKTYAALAQPKLVIAVGTCAVSGGVFAGCPDVQNGADQVVPVDLYIPGCPPHPMTLIDGILRALGRVK